MLLIPTPAILWHEGNIKRVLVHAFLRIRAFVLGWRRARPLYGYTAYVSVISNALLISKILTKYTKSWLRPNHIEVMSCLQRINLQLTEILSSTVIDHLQKNLAKADDSTLAYFYFDYNDTRKQNISKFLSCMLSQLTKACDEVPGPLLVLFKTHKDQEGRPSAETHLNTFIQITRHWSSVFLVIDALDECEQHVREDLLKVLETLATSDAQIRIFTTSRAEQDIKEFMVDAADYTIAIQNDRVGADIGLYVRAVLNADPKM